jgi:nicotinamidase-related amidase
MLKVNSLRLRADDATLLVVDIQKRLLPHIARGEEVAAAAIRMIRGAGVLKLPVVTTEQYPKGIGPTVANVQEAFEPGTFRAIEKMTFSCCATEPIVTALSQAGRSRIIVVGIEAHVCVMQTVLDLLALGYVPFVCADAIGSRHDIDRDTAIERMRQAGAVITTTESAMFELLHRAGTPEFIKILKIVK